MFSAKSGKILGELIWGRGGGLFACDFASTFLVAHRRLVGEGNKKEAERESGEEDDDDDDDDEEEEIKTRTEFRRSLLAVGGKDCRICLWQVYPPYSYYF